MSSEGKPRSKCERLSLTCNICRSRHQKCNGARPLCYSCHLRGLTCSYPDVPDGEQPARRQKRVASNEKQYPLSNGRGKQCAVSVNDSQEGYGATRDILASELANNGVPSEKIDELAQILADTVVLQSRLTEPQNHQHSSDLVFETTGEQLLHVLSQLWKEKGHDPGPLPETTVSATRDSAAPSAWRAQYSPPNDNNFSLPSKEVAQEWLMTLLNGPNRLLCICDHAESLQLLDALYDPQVTLSPVSTCLIFWLLTTGCRFSEVSEEPVYRGMYKTAGRLLDERIDEETGSLFWLVQVLLLKCVYWMSEKEKMCWVTLGAAIHIAETEGLDLDREQCRHLSDEGYNRRRQVWNAAIFLSAWLAIVNGRIPQIDPYTTRDPFIQDSWKDISNPDQELGVNMAKLSVVVNKFLRDVYTSTDKPATAYEKYLHMLEDWSSSLPLNLRYFPDHVASEAHSNFSTIDELSSLYLEMFYLATVLLLTRPLLLRDVHSRSTRSAPTLSPNMRFFVHTCTDAAIQIGHISSKMVPQGFICKRSWLASTIIYHACLTLLLDLSVGESQVRWGLTSAQEKSRRQLKKHGLQVGLDVLTYCATKSTDTQTMVETVKTFQRLIDGPGLSTPESLRENLLPAVGPSTSLSDSTSPSWYGNLPATSFTNQSPIRPSSSLVSDGMADPNFGRLATFSSQSSNESAIPSESSSSMQYFANKPWNDTNQLLYSANLDQVIVDQSAQRPMVPQHFQNFLQGFPNYQDPREVYQYQYPSFSTG